MPMAARTFLMRFRLASPRRIIGGVARESRVRGVDRHRLCEICQKVSAVKQLPLVEGIGMEWNGNG